MNPTKGVSPANLEIVQRACRPGETVVAACYGIHRATSGSQLSGVVFGSLGERALGMTTPMNQEPRPGMAGYVPGGPILIVATSQRLLTWAIDQKVPVALVGAFEAEHVLSVRRRNNLATGRELFVRFADGSMVTVTIDGVAVGKGISEAVTMMRDARGLPRC